MTNRNRNSNQFASVWATAGADPPARPRSDDEEAAATNPDEVNELDEEDDEEDEDEFDDDDEGDDTDDTDDEDNDAVDETGTTEKA